MMLAQNKDDVLVAKTRRISLTTEPSYLVCRWNSSSVNRHKRRVNSANVITTPNHNK